MDADELYDIEEDMWLHEDEGDYLYPLVTPQEQVDLMYEGQLPSYQETL